MLAAEGGALRLELALLAVLAGTGAADAAEPTPPCVACRADTAALSARYTAEEWDRLHAGEVVTGEAPESAEERRVVSASGLVPAAPAAAWAVITDHAAYPRFMPNVASTQVTARTSETVSLAQHLRILFVDVRYSTLWTLDAPQGLATWRLDDAAPHDIAGTSGAWQLAPLADGDTTLVRYHAAVDTGRPVPAPIERLLTRSSLPRVMHAVREEVARRAEP